jgi:DNA-binding Lrp family transcriptional regulator
MASSCSLVEKLEDNGIIEGCSIKVSQAKLGCIMHTFINIYIYGKNNSCTRSYYAPKTGHLDLLSGGNTYIEQQNKV